MSPKEVSLRMTSSAPPPFFLDTGSPEKRTLITLPPSSPMAATSCQTTQPAAAPRPFQPVLSSFVHTHFPANALAGSQAASRGTPSAGQGRRAKGFLSIARELTRGDPSSPSHGAWALPRWGTPCFAFHPPPATRVPPASYWGWRGTLQCYTKSASPGGTQARAVAPGALQSHQLPRGWGPGLPSSGIPAVSPRPTPQAASSSQDWPPLRVRRNSLFKQGPGPEARLLLVSGCEYSSEGEGPLCGMERHRRRRP